LVKGFSSWAIVTQLRQFANCVKHGEAEDGDCEKLREVRPDLFSNPAVENAGTLFADDADAPLTGRGLYLTSTAFEEFAAALRTFWKELGQAMIEGEPPLQEA
jgi:hypothetical protein